MCSRSMSRALFGLVMLLACASGAMAQAGPGGPGGGPPDFAQMRQRFLDRIKELMGASDDEWKVLSPKIEKVQQLQRESRGGGMGFMFFGGPGGPGGGPGGPGGPGANQPQSPVQQAFADLRTTLENKDAKADDVKAKLKALRDARTQAKADLTKSQEELRDLLTAKQEAVLVMLGMLD